MSGTLYVVATPIGNLEDITLRALRILREASVIAAEDTRRTAILLRHHGIRTPAVSFHEHNTAKRVPELISRLVDGSSVALVSDAGTPLLSDPGLELVRECVDRRIPVDPIPGPSAVLAALVGSAFRVDPVTWFGFPPVKAKARKKWLSVVCAIDHTVVFFESPHRILTLLRDASHMLGNRPIVIARELTKLHQEFKRGTAEELANSLNVPRGEFTVVIGPRGPETSNQPHNMTSCGLSVEFGQLTDGDGLTRRQAISTLAKKYGRRTREIYSVLENEKRALS